VLFVFKRIVFILGHSSFGQFTPFFVFKKIQFFTKDIKFIGGTKNVRVIKSESRKREKNQEIQ
jgi:hypothetical protein